MTQHEDDVDLFKRTVLGIQCPASYVMHEGILKWYAKPIRKDAEPNLTLIAEISRSPTPPHNILNWIADLFDKDTGGDYKIDRLVKRTDGPTYIGISASIEIAEFVQNFIDEKKGEYEHDSKHPKWKGIRKEAIHAARLHFGEKDENGKPIKYKAVSESKIEGALTAYKKAKEEHDRIRDFKKHKTDLNTVMHERKVIADNVAFQIRDEILPVLRHFIEN